MWWGRGILACGIGGEQQRWAAATGVQLVVAVAASTMQHTAAVPSGSFEQTAAAAVAVAVAAGASNRGRQHTAATAHAARGSRRTCSMQHAAAGRHAARCMQHAAADAAKSAVQRTSTSTCSSCDMQQAAVRLLPRCPWVCSRLLAASWCKAGCRAPSSSQQTLICRGPGALAPAAPCRPQFVTHPASYAAAKQLLIIGALGTANPLAVPSAGVTPWCLSTYS